MSNSRVRQLYQSDLLYVCTGNYGNASTMTATGAFSSASVWGNYLSATSGVNFVTQLHRITKLDDSWSRRLVNVNQIGMLSAIDRVTLEQPTVNLGISWIQNNLVNESLIGLNVTPQGSPNLVSCISGILNQTTEPTNYFNKITSEGTDAISLNPASYDVVSLGNVFIDSYTAQGRVGDFPTVDCSFRALNIQAQTVTQAVGAQGPAVYPGSGTPVTGWAYVLPTGIISYNNAGLTSVQGISALRPGDINLSLGLNAGDGFAQESDLKVQSYSLSLPFNREDILKLGSKYAFAIVPRYPLEVSLSVEAIIGANQTGVLTEIVNNNNAFNPSITINQPGVATPTPIIYYKLGNARLQDNTFAQSTTASYRTIRMTFVSQIGSPSDVINGLFMSGVTAT